MSIRGGAGRVVLTLLARHAATKAASIPLINRNLVAT